ncbi:SDR family NAD(P)-dependent oxidoreductase [Streptomyces sp. NPDC056831]|uniref:SDR family NAD(P)-dependent oxidoreductase n=1 Tax=Streptomyces sp. NPDC056831 TaxID=3345954 RepID=UPI00367754DA
MVTGGAGGIGAVICRVLIAQGATVVAADRKRRRTDTPWGRRGATPSNRWTPGSG